MTRRHDNPTAHGPRAEGRCGHGPGAQAIRKGDYIWWEAQSPYKEHLAFLALPRASCAQHIARMGYDTESDTCCFQSQTTVRLCWMPQVVEDTIQVATSTAETLDQQTEQLERVLDNLDEIQFSLHKAKQVIRDITRGLATDKCAAATWRTPVCRRNTTSCGWQRMHCGGGSWRIELSE